MLDVVVLTAETKFEDGIYLTTLNDLGLESSSESLGGSQEELVHILRSWIELQDTAGTLEEMLFRVGFSDVGEGTEIQLAFNEAIQAVLGQTNG
jgi:hypothetical protein